jgi:hypothetical protein
MMAGERLEIRQRGWGAGAGLLARQHERGERATTGGKTVHQKNVDAYTNVLSSSREK